MMIVHIQLQNHEHAALLAAHNELNKRRKAAGQRYLDSIAHIARAALLAGLSEPSLGQRVANDEKAGEL